ncbi:MAG TPA: cation diffusion facilitator family transporter [Gemmatimonadaceae bacterium]|nr:cation diffusion facilitator family transporter [Gemmatimonadaceae bacterium]
MPSPHSAHSHSHSHSHANSGAGRRLSIALAITLLLLVGEAIGGWMANSLALLADAGHVLTDGAALMLALFVTWLARQPGSDAKTFGYLRWEILAALFNAMTLLLISVWIVVEAVLRFRTPEPVEGGLMFWVAVVGLIGNAISARILHAGHAHNLNVRAAYLHVLGDLLASVGVVIAALLVRYLGWTVADPVASIVTTIFIVHGAWRLLRESVDVLLEAAPKHIVLDDVRQCIAGIRDVEGVHDLHVWTVTSGMVALSAHAIVRDGHRHQGVLEEAVDRLRSMGINHVTLQLECADMTDREQHLHP